jgi:large exoprotein involved in heme utilization and adhesion
VTVRASDSVELSGTSGDGNTFSSILTQSDGAGNAGSVNIETGKLIVQGGALVSTATTSSGQGGSLVVKASDSVQLLGTSTSADNPRPSGLFALAEGSGKPGDLTIETRQFIARDGARASASNLGSAQEGGTLSVTASESVQLIGTSANGQDRSGLLVGTGGTGAAGELTIKTENLQVSDGAFVSARSLGEGRGGGNTNIQVGSLRLDEGSIDSTTTSRNGGNITLSVRDLLLLRRGSQITSSAGTEQQPGDGGNITINARNGIIVAVPGENSNITANAFSGRGGQIEINTSGLFGIQPSPQSTPENDITAFSERGISGEIVINRPDVEQRLELVELPTVLADTLNLVDTGCTAIASTDADTEKNTFIITGRGGLPPTPYDPISTDVIWSDTRVTMLPLRGGEARKLGDRENSTTSPHRPVTSSIPKTHDGVPIVPATGWVFDGKGNVTLISHASNANGLGSTAATCSKR